MSEPARNATLRMLATLVKIFAWSYSALALFGIVAVGYETFKGPAEIVVSAGPVEPSVPVWPIILMVAGFMSLLAMAGLFITALVWIFKAHANLRDQNIPLDYSPGWAVGSYFVPVANLFVPFRAMRELHNRSHGEIPEHAHSGVEDVAAWWTAYIIAIMIWTALAFKLMVDVLTNIVFLTPAWMEFGLTSFAQLLMIVASMMLIKLVAAITTAQANSSNAWNAFE